MVVVAAVQCTETTRERTTNLEHVTGRRLSLFWRTLWNSHGGREKKLKNTKRKLKSVQMFSTKRDLELGRVFDLLIVNLFLTKTKMKSGKVNDPPAAAGLSMLTPPFKTSHWQGCMSLSLHLSPRRQLDDRGA